MLARRSFAASVPVRSHDAAGSVQGLDEALGSILDEVATWAASAGAAPR